VEGNETVEARISPYGAGQEILTIKKNVIKLLSNKIEALSSIPSTT
jgi:hypothetical protein